METAASDEVAPTWVEKFDVLGRAQRALGRGQVSRARRLLAEARTFSLMEFDARWMARVEALAADLAQVETRGTSQSGSTSFADGWRFGLSELSQRRLLYWAYISAGLMGIGAIGPWIRSPIGTVSGMDGSNDGWWVLLGAAVALAGLVFATNQRVRGIVVTLGGLFGASVAIYDRAHLDRLLSRGGHLVQALVQVGWGLNLAVVAAVSLIAAGLALAAASRSFSG